MPNKYYSDVSDYLVEGAKDSNYLKKGKGGFGDGKTSNPISDYNEIPGDASGWFEGKKGNIGRGEAS